MNDDSGFDADLRQALTRRYQARRWSATSLWPAFLARRNAEEGKDPAMVARGERAHAISRKRLLVTPYAGGAWVRWMGAGLAGAVLVAGVISLYHNSRSAGEPLAVTAYATQPGQHMSLALDESTRVTLAPASGIRVTRATGNSTSAITVDVTGNVLFSVQHAAARPVTVTAYGVITRVLGTEFSVRAHDAKSVRVAVREGRVSVQAPGVLDDRAVIVEANQFAAVGHKGETTTTAIRDPDAEFSWAHGQLVLRDAALRDVLPQLSRWYGLEFETRDSSLLDLKLDAVFEVAYSDIRMREMAEILGAQVRRNGKRVTFSMSSSQH